MGSASHPRHANAIRAGIASILVFATLLTFLPASPAAARQGSEHPTLELPAMVFTPTDLAAAAMSGYRLTGGEIGGNLAGIAGDWTDQITNDDIQATLESSGLLRSYSLGFRVTVDPAVIRSDVSRDLIVSVHEFSSANGAADGLAFIDQLSAAYPEIQRVEGAGPITSNAVLVRVPPADPADPVADLSIVFQVDRIIAVIEVIDYLNQEPTAAEAETLAMLLSERIDAGLAGDTPGLGAMALRLKDVEFDSLFEIRRDEYQRRAGEDFANFLEEDSVLALRTAAAGDAVDAYAFIQFVQDTDSIDPSLPFQFAWVSRIYRFADDQAAAAWLAARPDQIQATSDVPIQDLQIVDGAPMYGDESTSVTYTYDEAGSSPSKIFRVFLRVGDRTADIYLISSTSDPFPDTTIQAFASVQAQCLTAGCPEPIVITDALDGAITIVEPQNVPATSVPQAQVVADLASMTLTPADLAALQLPGFGVGAASTTYPDTWIQSMVEDRGLTDEQVRAAVGVAGFIRRYDNQLYLPADVNDPAGPIGEEVITYIVEFSSDAGAAGVFDFLEDESGNSLAGDVPLSAPIGDRSEATRQTIFDPDMGEPFEAIDVTFQVGNLHAGVAMIGWQGQIVELSQVESLAQRLLQRIESASNGNAPGLSNLTLRLGGPGIETVRDQYLLLSGQAIAQYGETQQDVTGRETVAPSEAQTDIYRVQQTLPPGAEDPEGNLGVLIDVTRYSDEPTAAAWLAGVQGRVSSNSAYTNVQFLAGPTFGDESVMYTLTTSDGTVAYRGIAFRVGTIVANLDISGSSDPHALLVVALADAQEKCLEIGGCPVPFIPPASLP